MNITNVQVKLIGDGNDRLKASCTIAIDGEFVIRDVKVIEGTNGLFVAMPSRKLSDHCPKCSHKNALRSSYCNNCGTRLKENRWSMKDGVAQLHAEIAHPINAECRASLHETVIAAYEEELDKREEAVDDEEEIEYFDFDDGEDDEEEDESEEEPRTCSSKPRPSGAFGEGL